ncbi:hypothetical protein LZ30DRAFT_783104 [Colletotrichum cereale]|nr:hypothetical protein LZ30DRAFT_783104 [Colletotrichum cereale]
MSGMHSTFSSSVTGDNRHSYAILSALRQGCGTSTGSNATGGSQSQQKGADAASVSSFGSFISLPKDTYHDDSSAVSPPPSVSKKSPSLVARQRAAEDAEAKSTFVAGPVRNDL